MTHIIYYNDEFNLKKNLIYFRILNNQLCYLDQMNQTRCSVIQSHRQVIWIKMDIKVYKVILFLLLIFFYILL